MRRFSVLHIIALISTLALGACSSSGEDPVSISNEGASSDATFLVNQVSGSIEAANSDAVFSSVSTIRHVNFTACVRDVAVMEAVVGLPFMIREGSNSLARATTDSNGCLHWSEKTPVQTLAPESYLETTRTIEALKSHKGSVTIKLALNPWQVGSSSVLDLRYQQAPKIRAAGTQNLTQNEAGLVVDSMNAEINIINGDDMSSILQLQFQPKVRRRNINGSTLLETLSNGKFLIRHQLVALENGSAIALYEQKEFIASFNGGQVRTRDNVKIVRKPAKESLLELRFTIEPVNAPEGLSTISGSVLMGHFTSLVLKSSTEFHENESNQLAIPVDVMTADNNKQIESGGFVIGKVESTRATVMELAQGGYPSKIKVSMQTCLKNSISDAPILNQKFTLESGNDTKEVRTDPERGCIFWDEIISFNYYNKESYIQRGVRLTASEGFYRGTSTNFTLHLNPWQYTQAQSIALDGRYETPSITPAVNGNDETKLVIAGSAFNFESRSFELDSFLNISETRKFRLEVRASLKRMTMQGWKEDPIIGGKYNLYILVKPLDSNKNLAAVETPVEFNAGAINTIIHLKFSDLSHVVQRNRLLVELRPANPNSQLQAVAYEGVFDAVNNGGWIRTLERTRSSIVSEVRGFRYPSRNLEFNTTDLFVQSNKLAVPTKSTIAKMQLGQAQIRTLILDKYKNPHILKKLCGYFYENKMYSNEKALCERDPNKYLTTANTEHVIRLVGDTRLKNRDPLKSGLMGLSVSAGFGVAKSESHDNTVGSTLKGGIDASLGIGGKNGLLGGSLGISGGYGWFHTNSVTKRNSQDVKVDGGVDKKLDVETILLEFDAEIQRCLLVTPSSDLKYSKPKQANAFMCLDKLEQRTVAENYYFLYQNYFPGVILDTGANSNERQTILIRGEQRFQDFQRLVQDGTLQINLQEGAPVPARVLKATMDRYDGYFPGLLSQ